MLIYLSILKNAGCYDFLVWFAFPSGLSTSEAEGRFLERASEMETYGVEPVFVQARYPAIKAYASTHPPTHPPTYPPVPK